MRLPILLPLLLATMLLGIVQPAMASQDPQDTLTEALTATKATKDDTLGTPVSQVEHALIRLPLAALLGALLAARPRRQGTPPRKTEVMQTQIILAIVGALVMMVVGANLARAFGVVGAAGLVRYRANIEDPKDAGVMLSTLGIGLSTGVGLYVLASISAAFILVALWVLESLEPHGQKRFEVKIKIGDDTDQRRPEMEAIFKDHGVRYDLRSAADREVCYEVRVPYDVETEHVSDAILKMDPKGHASVEWSEKKVK